MSSLGVLGFLSVTQCIGIVHGLIVKGMLMSIGVAVLSIVTSICELDGRAYRLSITCID